MKIAVIGAGMIGRLRARSVHAHKATSLTAVIDTDTAAAAQAAKGTGADVGADYRTVLGDVDAVVIATPVTLHREMVLAALDAGCHVFVEKPLTNQVASATEVALAAEQAQRTLAVGFNHRYYPAMKFVRRVLDEKTIGTVDEIRVFGGHDGLGNFRADWMFRGEQSGGGAMMDVGLHMTDLTRFFGGDIAEVYGVADGRVWNVDGSEDRAVAIFKTADGVPVTYEATWNEWQGYEVSVEVYGDRGMVRGSYAPMTNVLITQDKPGAPRRVRKLRYLGLILKEKLRGWQSTTLQTFNEELDDFLRMIEGEATPLATAWDGVRAIEVAQAVYESSRTGAPVTLAERSGAANAT